MLRLQRQQLRTWSRLLLLLLLLLINAADCAPPRKGKVFGPCVGMDCLHGVLMHGDAKLGNGHGVEDAEKHREELERQNAGPGEKPGQMNQEEFMHGVLMHGDAAAGSAHSHEPAPTVEKRPLQSGPMSQEDLMHGVLMHGDSDPSHRHRHGKADDAALKAAAAAADTGAPGVESRPPGFADSEDDSFVSRWWRTLKYLVMGGAAEEASSAKQRPASAADYNLMQDLAAVGSTKTIVELEKAAGHSHRDTDRVHRDRNRKEHSQTVHVEH